LNAEKHLCWSYILLFSCLALERLRSSQTFAFGHCLHRVLDTQLSLIGGVNWVLSKTFGLADDCRKLYTDCQSPRIENPG
jgi:hypothetical protein